MWWHYLLVFAGALLVDVVPVPLPPAFTIIVLLQPTFDLNIWLTIAVGVAGSVAGRYILSMYIPKVSGKLFKPAKNEDVQHLGRKLKSDGWKGPAFILVYSLMPLSTTPLFVADGMAKLKPYYIIPPPFVVGKLLSDTVAVLPGKEAVANVEDLMEGMVSWKSVAGLAVGLGLLFRLFFFDWRTLLQLKQLRVRFAVWR
jgi:membrane protein DedA with SNARE-associated domain